MADTTPFHDLDTYIALPRLTGLDLSSDGTRLVTRMATLGPKKNAFVSALWEVDPAGERAARRLTRSAKGEGQAVFAPSGEILFVSARPDPAGEDDDAPAALWALPPHGEARVVASAPGGIEHVEVASDSGRIVVQAPMLPAATTLAEDAKRRKARKDAKVGAILHSGMPIRFWDEDLGPDFGHLLTADADAWRAEDAAGQLPPSDPQDPNDEQAEPRAQQILRDVTADPGKALTDGSFEVSADGSLAVATWQIPAKDGYRMALAVIDLASGERRIVFDSPEAEAFGPALSPDASQIAFIAEEVSTSERAPRMKVGLVPAAGGEARFVATDWDRWPNTLTWLPDGSALVVTADEHGRGPIFLLDLATEQVRRLTADDGTYSDVCVSPDGATLYALRASYLTPALPVRVDVASGEVRELPPPASAPALPGTLSEVRTTASDGRELRAWLALPDGASKASPAPLAVWIHGGPLSSWNAWSWRWCPWLLVAAGYAVVLPDPALSTGYGQDFIQVGWQDWGEAPYTDVLALTDATCERADIDATRTCAMGGSFGGYMANWVAGHTDRFKAIVTHASLWALDQFKSTTDGPFYWRREMDEAATERNDPHLSVDKIVTPMLVVHGDNDYRVPISEGVRLFGELAEHYAADDGTMPHRFLYFPDENHWVLGPQNAKVWYQTVLAFLAQHVLGEPEHIPDLLT